MNTVLLQKTEQLCTTMTLTERTFFSSSRNIIIIRIPNVLNCRSTNSYYYRLLCICYNNVAKHIHWNQSKAVSTLIIMFCIQNVCINL